MSIRRFGMMFRLNRDSVLVEKKTTIVQQNKIAENVIYLYFIAECIGKDMHGINSAISQEKRQERDRTNTYKGAITGRRFTKRMVSWLE